MNKLIILLLVGMLSCSKTPNIDEFFWEIPLDGTSAVINCMVYNIEFKFCLLNEAGVPATGFKEGEIFSFHFAMINHRKDELYTIFSHLECELPIHHVISMNHQDTIHLRYRKHSLCPAGINPQPFYGKDNKREATTHWDEQQIESNNEPGLKFFHQPPLPAGEYYTEVSPVFMFHVGPNYPFYYIGPLTFKINFKIE